MTPGSVPSGVHTRSTNSLYFATAQVRLVVQDGKNVISGTGNAHELSVTFSEDAVKACNKDCLWFLSRWPSSKLLKPVPPMLHRSYSLPASTEASTVGSGR